MTTTMREITYGIEIETIGLDRETVAGAIRTVVGGTVRYAGGGLESWLCVDDREREWKVSRDGSLNAPSHLQAEIASPKLNWDDMATLQKVVRAVRAAGAKVDSSCGIHVHIDGARFDAGSLSRLAKTIYRYDDLITNAFGILTTRRSRWCKPVGGHLINQLQTRKPKTMDDWKRLWYGRDVDTRSLRHYDDSRYHGLNYHNLWYRRDGSIEFRLFNGTLHAGKIRAYICFCLAVGAKALSTRSATTSRREYREDTAKYDFRIWLLSLGLSGDEFKNVRKHLLSRLPGDSAFRDSRRRAA